MTGHLIHIGYPKTGSNYLRRWFSQHPQIGYAEGGIAGFQNVYAMVRDSARRAPPPLCRVTSAEGFATPHSSFGLARMDFDAVGRQPMVAAQATACRLLAEIFPDAHILIVTRGFRSATLSAYSQYVREGGPMGVRDFCASGEGQSPWHYEMLIRQYRAAFGPGKVLVLPWELLRDDPAAFLRAITDLIGVDEAAISAERANPSLSAIELAWYPHIARLLRALFPRGRMRRGIDRVWPRFSQQNRMKRPIALLQRIWPLPPITAADFTDEVIASWIFPSETLRDDPRYRAYAAEYFLDIAR